MAHIKTLHSHVALNIITGLSEQMPFTSQIQQKDLLKNSKSYMERKTGLKPATPSLEG